MTAGSMSIQGGVTIVMDTGLPHASWKHTVKKVGTFYDTSVCSVSVTPTVSGGFTPFGANCGTQSAGTYYLYVERVTSNGLSDERICTGSGTLTTQ